MALLLYTLTALALLWLAHRALVPLSRAAAVILFLLPFVFTGHALIANRVFAPIDRTYADPPLSDLAAQYGIGGAHNPVVTDIYAQMIPWRHVLRETLARGEWPLWNPTILCGDVLAASAQAAPYSPFTLIALLMPAAISFTYTAAITLFLAALVAFVFLRELELSEAAAIFGAAAWMSSTAIVLYVLWPLGLCWALLPLILFATRRSVRAPGFSSWALLTASLTLLIMAGHPESVLHIVFCGAVYGVFELIPRLRTTPRVLVTTVSAGVVTLLLCAIYLMPIAEAIPQTSEYQYRHFIFAHADWRSAPTLTVLIRIASDFFPFLHLRSWTSPEMKDIKGETAVVGSIVLALAAYALVRARSRQTWFFAGLALFALLAHVEWGPLVRIFQKLPLFDIALQERFAFAQAFCLCVLAAIGLDAILQRNDRRAAMLITLAVAALLAIGTYVLTHRFGIANGPVDWGKYKIPAELVVLPLAALLFLPRVPQRILVPALLALLLVQRVASEGGIWRSFPARAAYPPVPLFEPMRAVKEPFRVVGHQFALIPGTNALYGLDDVRGYEAMTLGHYYVTYPLWCEPQTVWFNRVDDLSKPILSMLNVRFAVAKKDYAPPPGWKQVSAYGQSVLLENTNVLPRAFVPSSVTAGLDYGITLEEMRAATDFASRAWIVTNEPPYERGNGPGRVSVRRTKMNQYEADAEMENDGWVVLSESSWQGWRAYVDGRRVHAHRANIAFLSVYVPRGKHHVRFVYWPRAFVQGRTISGIALLGVLVTLGIRRRRRS
ncbi:MAG TPA: YfhO family protein [Thermoanaerobaculia bacterium]|nr:YfhO family protein [Thermoanaerobaculia bacterium]